MAKYENQSKPEVNNSVVICLKCHIYMQRERNVKLVVFEKLEILMTHML